MLCSLGKNGNSLPNVTWLMSPGNLHNLKIVINPSQAVVNWLMADCYLEDVGRCGAEIAGGG